MKALKVIGKTILVFIPVILIWVYFALFPMNYMDGEYSYYTAARDYRLGKTDEPAADVLILGDSRAKSALNPEQLDSYGADNCVSMAQGGSTSVEAYFALKEYIENKGIPKAVIVSVSSYHFTSFDGFFTRTLYFNAMDTDDAAEVISKAREAGEKDALKAAGGSGLITLFEYKIKSPTKYIAPFINSFGEDRKTINEEAYKEMQDRKGFKSFVSWWPTSAEHDMTEFLPLKTLGDYYRKLIDLCIENDIEVYSVNTPLIATTFEESRKIAVPFSEYLESIKKDYPEETYPKVHIETLFEDYDERYFDDADHLNPAGAEIYTREFFEKYPEVTK